MWKAALVLTLGFVAGGCGVDDASDDDGGSSGAGGTSAGGSSSGKGGAGTGGAAGSSSGKSGGGSGGSGGGETSARAALSLNILAPNGCSLPEGYFDLPELSGGHPVTATSKGELLVDGGMTAEDEAVTITCSLFGDATGYFFDGFINVQTRAAVTLGGYPLVEGETGEGGIVVLRPLPPGQYGTPADSCTQRIIELDPEARSIWGEISCPIFETPDQSDTCAIGTSYYVFENCET